MAGDSDARRTVTGKVLALLAAFTPDAPELTLSELARRAGLSLATAHRRAAELVEWGALERSATGRYHIGLRLWEVASLAPRGVGLREASLPFLEDLYEITRENVQLAVRDGVELVFVERIAGRDAVAVLIRIGGRFALHATGSGMVLLAHAPVEVQERVLRSRLDRYTEKTITDPTEMRAVLAHVRANGYAISDGHVTLDALSVAAPIIDATGSVIAAVSLVVHAGRVDPAALAPVVRAAALGISRELGGPGRATPTTQAGGLRSRSTAV
jgi:DNA-binding IclR family transcriptional regulator